MTHNDIYTKYMIEYDKANVTSSYPSMTEYEVATILDKAYYALIAQKVTGNNPRQVPFESDVKSIADMQPLVKHLDMQFDPASHDVMGINIAQIPLPEDFMYYVELLLEYDASVEGATQLGENATITSTTQPFESQDSDSVMSVSEMFYSNNQEELPSAIDWQNLYYSSAIGDPVNSFLEASSTMVGPYDRKAIRLLPVKLTSHDVAEKFMVTAYNMPWVKVPVAYIQEGKVNIVYDPIKKPLVDSESAAHFVYVKKPAPFATTKEEIEVVDEEEVTKTVKYADFSEETQFELLDSMAEELINLAIIMTLENVESARLGTKINTRALES